MWTGIKTMTLSGYVRPAPGRLPVILASCDPVYLMSYAPAFIASCAMVGYSAHLHVSSPDEFSRKRLDQLAGGYASLAAAAGGLYDPPRFTSSMDNAPTGWTDPEKQRVYHSTRRFSVAAALKSIIPDLALVIVDVDSVFVNPLKLSEGFYLSDFGLFTRDSLPGTVGWEAAGTKVAAGIVSVGASRVGGNFISEVSRLIDSYQPVWFADQVALEAARKNAIQDGARMWPFGPSDLDWEFAADTSLWTGKGDRKTENMRYVKLVHMATTAMTAAINQCEVLKGHAGMWPPLMNLPRSDA